MNKDKFQINIDEMNFIYADGKHQLQNLNLVIDSGKVTALLGSNGAGKSTLFKCLTGQLKATSGSITIGDSNITQAVKSGAIAYVPQLEEIDLNFPISVFDVIAQGRYPYINWLRLIGAKDKEIILQAARDLAIENLLDYQISQLSGGQRKRMFLARALAQKAKVIFLDEPFTGVDVYTEGKIMEILIELRNQGKLILVATHNVSKVTSYCDNVVHLNNNKAVVGDAKTMITQIFNDSEIRV